MHGIKKEHFYKTPEEEQKFKLRLVKGYNLLDSFVEYLSNAELLSTCEEGNSTVINEQDDRMFELSWAIIEFMPEFVASWNYRKRYIIKKSIGSDIEVILSLLFNELENTASILKLTPKSYEVWHHRLWIITLLFIAKCKELKTVLFNEFNLCFKFFKYDGRNFHCWSHLNYIIHYFRLLSKSISSDDNPNIDDSSTKDVHLFNSSSLKEVDNFNSSTKGIDNFDIDNLSMVEFDRLINVNISNYSAWYQRSNLSHLLDSPSGDLELLKQAIYTDPQDQCIWMYYNWFLFERDSLKNYLVSVLFNKEKLSFVLFFNNRIKLSKHTKLYKCRDGEFIELIGSWTSINDGLHNLNLPSYVWIFNCTSFIMPPIKMEIVFDSFDDISNSFYSRLQYNSNFNIYSKDINEDGNDRVSLKLIYHFNSLNDGYLHIDLNTLEVKATEGIQRSGTKLKEVNEVEDAKWRDDDGLKLGNERMQGNLHPPYSFQKPIYVKGIGITSIGRMIDENILKEQLEMINELISIDSESKYALISRMKIMQYLGHDVDYKAVYDRLSSLDEFRCKYYHDMYIKYKIRDILHHEYTHCDLSNLEVSTLNYATLTPYFNIKTLNLSHNYISDSSLIDLGIIYLPFIEHVNLSSNKFKSLEKILKYFDNTFTLERLNLSRNPLGYFEDLSIISSHISEIDITQTPLADGILHEIKSGNTLQAGRHKVYVELSNGLDTLTQDLQSYTSDQLSHYTVLLKI